MQLDKDQYRQTFNDYVDKNRIKESSHFFKIKLFLQKAENSLLIAKFHHDINPNKDQAPKLY